MKPLTRSATLVFYDGACAVCRAEMQTLKRRDRDARLELIDIAAPDFDPTAWPASIDDMNTVLHVRRADGTWLKGMAAIRHVYRVIGRGWLLAPTGWPVLSRAFDLAYAWFARHRMAISGSLSPRRCANGVCHRPL